jgi:protein-S-isoprenylcysteine O-methyltransferase Ste14
MVNSGKREKAMGATKIEFRLRVTIITVIITLGFWAPWIEGWGIGRRISLWEWLALELSRLGIVHFAVAVPLVIAVAALIAAKGALLRIWGTAYLGSATVNHGEMMAGAVLADGPFRYVRNPLYLGSWCMFAAMAFLMPPTGALFVAVLITVFQMRLIYGEEAFLTGQLGEPYIDYLHAVPRLIPHLRAMLSRTGPAPSDRKPQWLHAFVGEINPIGVFIILAFFSWSYNNWLMIKAIIVSFGLSLVVRALVPRNSAP